MKMKVAIVYDRVNKWGGAERVLLALHKIYPRAPLYTSVYDPKSAPWAKAFPRVVTSFLQKIPFAKRNHEFFAPLMPLVFWSFDFSDFDLVISVTSEFAKNIKTSDGTLHVCYCLTPTRYLWSGYNDYFRGKLYKTITRPIIRILRNFDRYAAKRPDVMIAISTEVKKRIKKYYHRNSEIVFPPVDVKKGRLKPGKYYLLVSRLDYGYKKVDLAIQTFNKLGKKLIIVGSGREKKKLRAIAGKSIKFVGKVSDQKLACLYQNAKALIMPQEEDFGIVAVEAQGYGVPVIAYKKGGAYDTVIDRKTGILFNMQNEKSMMGAIIQFEKMSYKVDNLHINAERFSFKNFKSKFDKIVKHGTKNR